MIQPSLIRDDMPNIDDSVIDFVADYTGVKRERLTLPTTLFGDLGVDGQDGWELIASFGRRFEVDLSNFQAGQHFGPEGFPIYAPLVWFWWLITGQFGKQRAPEERARLKPIHISDLIEAAREKKWTL